MGGTWDGRGQVEGTGNGGGCYFYRVRVKLPNKKSWRKRGACHWSRGKVSKLPSRVKTKCKAPEPASTSRIRGRARRPEHWCTEKLDTGGKTVCGPRCTCLVAAGQEHREVLVHCFSSFSEIATDPTSWEWWGWERLWRLGRREADMKELSSGRVWEQMNYANVVGLPGSATKCPFEVSGHEFKARPVSRAVEFSPALWD